MENPRCAFGVDEGPKAKLGSSAEVPRSLGFLLVDSAQTGARRPLARYAVLRLGARPLFAHLDDLVSLFASLMEALYV